MIWAAWSAHSPDALADSNAREPMFAAAARERRRRSPPIELSSRRADVATSPA